MTIQKYLYTRYLKYVFLINISLTLLFNFIEFFEKVIRVKHATLTTIINFIALNIPTSFFENLPIACWLTTVFLIKELVQQNEWETFLILNVNYKKIIQIFLYTSLFVALFSFIGKEKIVLHIANNAEKFKQEKLKQNSQQILVNKWFWLSQERIFCNFASLNLKNNNGSNLLLIKVNQNHEIEQIITSKNFDINNDHKILNLKNSITNTLQNTKPTIKNNYKLKLPSLFALLKFELGIQPLSTYLGTILNSSTLISSKSFNELFYQLLQRILFHIQIILYPLLTLSLFMFFFYYQKYKWLVIFLPYPIMVIQKLIIDSLLKTNITPLISLIPYLFLFFIILAIQKKLEKTI